MRDNIITQGELDTAADLDAHLLGCRLTAKACLCVCLAVHCDRGKGGNRCTLASLSDSYLNASASCDSGLRWELVGNAELRMMLSLAKTIPKSLVVELDYQTVSRVGEVRAALCKCFDRHFYRCHIHGSISTLNPIRFAMRSNCSK